MAGSLFEQLKKTGLIDEQRAKKAKKQKHQRSKQNKLKKGQVEQSIAKKLAEEATQKKAQHDRLLNLERQQQQTKKVLQAELRQVIASNALTEYKGLENYNFADKGKVKTVNVNASVKKQLISGKLRIVRFNDSYTLVREEAVEKIEQRDKNILIALSKEDNFIAEEDKDYYARFEIPDDLIW